MALSAGSRYRRRFVAPATEACARVGAWPRSAIGLAFVALAPVGRWARCAGRSWFSRGGATDAILQGEHEGLRVSAVARG
eukprot:8816439-Lingulodinium_polyedra.AAC.1